MTTRAFLSRELRYFFEHHRAWWMLPLLVALVTVVRWLLVDGEGGDASPFVYSLF